MKPQEEIAKLQKENAALQEQVAGLKRRVEELEAAKPKSKSRDIAEKTLEMLKKGPVTVAQLAALNPKYPSDCIYYVRTLLKEDVKLAWAASGNVYMLAAQFQVYQEGLAKEKALQKAAKEEAKEAIPPTQTSNSAQRATAVV